MARLHFAAGLHAFRAAKVPRSVDMQNGFRKWTTSNATLFVNGVSAVAVLLGLLAIVYGKLNRGAGLSRGSLIPAADAGVAFVLLGISLVVLARWRRARWKLLFAQ